MKNAYITNLFLKRLIFLLRARFYLLLLIIPFILYIWGVNLKIVFFLYLILFFGEYCLYRWQEESRYAEEVRLFKVLFGERKKDFKSLYRKAGVTNPYPDTTEFGARTVDNVNPIHHLRKVTVRQQVDKFGIKRKKLIDIGALDGSVSIEYAVNGNKMFLTDLDAISLREAKKRVNCPCFISDIAFLPIKSETFDFVSLLEVIEHLQDPVKGIKGIERIMKKGGRILLTTPNSNIILPYYFIHPFIVAEKIIGLFFPAVLSKSPLLKRVMERNLWYPHTAYSKKELEALLIENGFQIKYLSCYHYLPDLHPFVLRGIKLMRRFMNSLKAIKKVENKSLTEEEYVRLIFPLERRFRKIPLIRWLGAQWLVIAEKA